jgi:protein-disulfide isomerase
MTPRTSLRLALSAAAIACLAACGGSSSPSTPATQVPVPVAGAPTRGPADAWVTVVEYGDFQCSFCVRDEPVVEGLVASYPADLRLVFKQFPLPASIHPRARAAALAAVCAGAQGRFWAVHDLLFAQADGLGDAAMEQYATTAGLELTAWRACLTSTEAGAAVDADVAEGIGFGVRGTPSYFVNGRFYEGAGLLDAQVIEAARAQAIASGVARDRYYQQVVLGH